MIEIRFSSVTALSSSTTHQASTKGLKLSEPQAQIQCLKRKFKTPNPSVKHQALSSSWEPQATFIASYLPRRTVCFGIY